MNKISTTPSLEEVLEKICDILTEWEEYCCLDNVEFRDWEDVKTFVDRQVEEEAEKRGGEEIPSL